MIIPEIQGFDGNCIFDGKFPPTPKGSKLFIIKKTNQNKLSTFKENFFLQLK